MTAMLMSSVASKRGASEIKMVLHFVFHWRFCISLTVHFSGEILRKVVVEEINVLNIGLKN